MPPHEQVVPRKPPANHVIPHRRAPFGSITPTLTRPHQGGGDAPLRDNTLAGGPYRAIQVSFSPRAGGSSHGGEG